MTARRSLTLAALALALFAGEYGQPAGNIATAHASLAVNADESNARKRGTRATF